MAFTVGKRCSLCGGRLNGKKICVECGLDNTKNDSIYKDMINRNECENEPLTHVHTHSVDPQSERERLRQKDEMQQDLRDLKHRLQQKYGSTGTGARTSSSRGTDRTNKKYRSTKGKANSGLKVGIVVWTIALIIGIVSAFFGIIESSMEDEYAWEWNGEWLESADYDYSTELLPGFYTVGVHIPEGVYDIQIVGGDFASVDVYRLQDGNLQPEDFWFFDYEENAVQKEEELTIGMVLRIYNNGVIACMSNDLTDGATYEESNKLTEAYSLNGQCVAGRDFPAGTYDLWYNPALLGEGVYEYGSIKYEIRNGENQSTLIQDTIYVNSEEGEFYYYNIPLMAGSVISIEEIGEVILIPSAVVPATNDVEAEDNSI